MQISEKFYSVQCEGVTSGVPAYFIRLPGCNLMCGGTGGELTKNGEATWWCDSEALWKQSKEVTNDGLLAEWVVDDILGCIKSGRIHIVWTGGEPAMLKNARTIIDFLTYFYNMFANHGTDMFNEIETNGTVITGNYNTINFYQYFQQINCSPKLSNSGIGEEKRIVPEAISQIMQNTNYWFKFVVSTENDVKEAFDDFIIPFNIDPKRVILMPGCDSQKEIIERTAFAFEMAKKYSVRAVTRAQILVWDKKPGV